VRAILGGTFDPVHVGHLHAARAAGAALETGSVTLLLAARPWHRPTTASARHRWRMLQLATESDPRLVASDLELKRPGPSYTVDTLAELARGSPEDHGPVVWLIGRDALDDIESWRHLDQLASLCHLLVLERPGTDSAGPPRIPPGFRWLPDPRELSGSRSGGMACLPDAMLDMSASRVRELIRQDGDASALLTHEVWSYIRVHGLYASPARGER